MGSEVNSKKRKATAPNDEVTKVKKVKQIAGDVPPKKRKVVGSPDSTIAKKLKTPKPGTLEDGQSASAEKSLPPKAANSPSNGTGAALQKPKSSSDIKGLKKELTGSQDKIDLDSNQEKIKEPELAVSALKDDRGDTSDTNDSDIFDETEVNDQTEALLKGFESDDDSLKDPDDQGYEVGDEIPKLGKKLKKKAMKAAEKASTSGKAGVVYIGRIPHGFYEQEMKQYFSQFGTITNLRLSRNRKTGKSKHFAFVEFESAEVAEIVSKTMDNYLLFGHILKCKLVAPEQVHKDLWIGANKRFKSIPRNKIQGRQLSQAMTVAGWEKRTAIEEKRRADKKEAVKMMGYDFESPKLKAPKDALKKSQQALTEPIINDQVNEESDEEGSKRIEAPKKMDDHVVSKESKKGKKQENDPDPGTTNPPDGATEVAEDLPAETPEPGKKKKKKTKKNKKAKSSHKLVGTE